MRDLQFEQGRLPITKLNRQSVRAQSEDSDDEEIHAQQDTAQPASAWMHLQRAHGNRFVQRVVDLMRSEGSEGDVGPEIERAIHGARGGGHALDSSVRARMEPTFKADFGGVRVHTDSRADALNRSLRARAFTTGQDIFFKQGEYSPGSSSGRQLLAHELTHVVQQNGSGVQTKLTLGRPGDKYEQEADSMAQAVLQKEQQGLQRQVEEEEEEPVQAKVEHGRVQKQMYDEGFVHPTLVQCQEAGGSSLSVPARWEETPEQKAFLERVLKAHIETKTKSGRKALPDLSNDELGTVSGTNVHMRRDAAETAGRLIADANQALNAAQNASDVDAKKTKQISAISGYRAKPHQENLWRSYFTLGKNEYYNNTAKARANLPGGEHGDAAVTYMVKYISPKIAPPGFSKHQAGLAIDFKQVRTKGNTISNSTNATEVKRWQATWFFKWLQDNAGTYGFVEYQVEPWHWIYQNKGGPSKGSAPVQTSSALQTSPTQGRADTSQDWLKRAVERNSTLASKIGWISRFDEIVNYFQTQNFLPPQQTPNQEVFAQAVKQYQSAQRITDDGILGPTTWKHIRAELPAARNNPNSSKGGAAPWIVVARGELGTKEFAGDKHNPRVIEYLKTTGSWWSTDETPWCSGFVNWVMQQAGYTGTNSAKAISWLTWGKKVSEPVLGAIGVISYGGGKGHVGFVVGTQGKNVLLLGGNQSNQVSINRTPVSKFSAFVVPQDYEAQSAAPTVEGSEKGVHQDLSYESTR